ncbi:hypothetical protein [Desulfomicrobium baculatum]|nr:hypothetical protein [Desulfomicrobium baculatum]
MSSDVPLNRRFFFRKSVASFLDCVCSGCNSKDEYSLLNDEKNKMSVLWSDFTPEMITFEAKRFGVDPEDKEEIFKRIQQEMLDAKS